MIALVMRRMALCLNNAGNQQRISVEILLIQIKLSQLLQIAGPMFLSLLAAAAILP